MHRKRSTSTGETLIPSLPKYGDYNQPEQARHASRVVRYGKYVLAYSLSMVAYNAGVLYDKFHTQGTRDDVLMIEDADFCEPFDTVQTKPSTGEVIVPDGFTDLQVLETLVTEATYATNTSSAYNLKPKQMNPIKTAEQLLNINSYEFDSFTSTYSGLEVHLYTDTEDPFKSVDTAVIDDLLHASLDDSVKFAHIAVSQFMECARDNVLLSRGGNLLQGERLNLYIASRPGMCWSNGLIQEYPRSTSVSFRDFCDSTGATIKDLEFWIVPGLISTSQSWMAVTSHQYDPETASQKISKALVHEFIHLYQQALGLPFKYNPNERLADHIEDQTIEELFSEDFPVAVHYSSR